MEIITPANEYWIHTTVDKTVMDYVWSQIKLAKNDAKSKLVGHVSSSLDLPDEKQTKEWWWILRRNFTSRQKIYFIRLLKRY